MTKPEHREKQRFLEQDIQAGLAAALIRAAIQVIEEHQVVPADWPALREKLLGTAKTIIARESVSRASSEKLAALRGAIDQCSELHRRCSNK